MLYRELKYHCKEVISLIVIIPLGIPGESGNSKVANPEPAFTSNESTCP